MEAWEEVFQVHWSALCWSFLADQYPVWTGAHDQNDDDDEVVDFDDCNVNIREFDNPAVLTKIKGAKKEVTGKGWE